MATTTPQTIVVDTNVYIRLYCSPVRPLLGAICQNHRFVITQQLHDEFGRNPSLVTDYGWMCDPAIAAERSAAILRLTRQQANAALAAAATLAKQAAPLLSAHCARQRIPTRQLSRADVDLLATVDALDCIVATDEWPMTLVALALGYPCLCSLDLLAMLEKDGKLDIAQRRTVVLDWVRMGEHLPRSWKATYRALFREMPPTPN